MYLYITRTYRGGSGGPAGLVWAGPLFTQSCKNYLLSVHQLLYASITHAAITNKIIKNLFNAYSYHVILLKMESSASSSNSADADSATSLEVSKPHQPRTFPFPNVSLGNLSLYCAHFRLAGFRQKF